MAPFKSALRREWAKFIRKGQRPKRDRDVIGFVFAAWEAVAEETVINSFLQCGIANSLDGSEDGLFQSRLVEINDLVEYKNELNDECIDLILDDDSDVSFKGFSDDEDN